MTRRANAHFALPLCAIAIAAALCLPAIGHAASGGGGLGPGANSGGSGGVGSHAEPGNVTVSASAQGMTIATRSSALLRNGLQVTGSLPSSDAGKVVEIERYGAKTNWAWEPTVQTTVTSNGSFVAVWRTNHIGQFAIRAVLEQAQGTTASAGWPTVHVTIYLPAIATLYGPGFWGQQTACGIRLRRNTLGVANRSLPCGTPVAVYYHGKTIVVPVIDRGPYANHANWDLTMATGRALGMQETETVGAVSLPRTR